MHLIWSHLKFISSSYHLFYCKIAAIWLCWSSPRGRCRAERWTSPCIKSTSRLGFVVRLYYWRCVKFCLLSFAPNHNLITLTNYTTPQRGAAKQITKHIHTSYPNNNIQSPQFGTATKPKWKIHTIYSLNNIQGTALHLPITFINTVHKGSGEAIVPCLYHRIHSYVGWISGSYN